MASLLELIERLSRGPSAWASTRAMSAPLRNTCHTRPQAMPSEKVLELAGHADDAHRPFPSGLLCNGLSFHARLSSPSSAVAASSCRLTYAELHACAQGLARALLRTASPASNDCVGILLSVARYIVYITVFYYVPHLQVARAASAKRSHASVPRRFKSAWMPVAVHAIQLTSATYVPIDPALPVQVRRQDLRAVGGGRKGYREGALPSYSDLCLAPDPTR